MELPDKFIKDINDLIEKFNKIDPVFFYEELYFLGRLSYCLQKSKKAFHNPEIRKLLCTVPPSYYKKLFTYSTLKSIISFLEILIEAKRLTTLAAIAYIKKHIKDRTVCYDGMLLKSSLFQEALKDISFCKMLAAA